MLNILILGQYQWAALALLRCGLALPGATAVSDQSNIQQIGETSLQCGSSD